ncbi:MAG: DUF349 domain-containing protein [Actinomycetota bacterium]|nr:DUF349 domain-containing protein [Actinomycetota bacterium]
MSSQGTEQWGRVDDAGTVWVRTADGERAVGSYPGVAPEEALSYFARKYDELAGQVHLLEQRVGAAQLAPKEAYAAIGKLRAGIAEGHAVGDLDALLVRLLDLVSVVESRQVEQEAARSRARDQARATKERIVAEAEELAQSSAWKPTGDRLRDLLTEWKAAPRLDRRSDDELWKRFSAARTAFDKRRRQHFAALDAQREESRSRKERLIAEAEELAGSTDWAATAARYRDLMTEWKAAGRAARDVDDELWQRFRSAQDRFFAARSGVFAEHDAGQRENLDRKEALAAEAEKLLPVTNPKAARAALRGIVDRWDEVGHVPRDAKERVEGRLRRVEQAIRQAEEGEWRRSNPEARARAEVTVSQLRSSIASFEATAAKARDAGNERKATEAEAAAAARREWLAEAEKTLAEFS